MPSTAKMGRMLVAFAVVSAVSLVDSLYHHEEARTSSSSRAKAEAPDEVVPDDAEARKIPSQATPNGWSDDSTVVPKDENEIDDSTVPDEPEIRKILSQAPLKLNFYDIDDSTAGELNNMLRLSCVSHAKRSQKVDIDWNMAWGVDDGGDDVSCDGHFGALDVRRMGDINFEDYQRRMVEFVNTCLQVLETSEDADLGDTYPWTPARYRYENAKNLLDALKISDIEWSWMPLSKKVRANVIARIQVLQKSYQSSEPTNDEMIRAVLRGAPSA